MLLFAFKVNHFFHFAKLSFRPKQVVSFNREERLCSPSLNKSTFFFLHCHINGAKKRFSVSRKINILKPDYGVKLKCHFLAIFAGFTRRIRKLRLF